MADTKTFPKVDIKFEIIPSVDCRVLIIADLSNYAHLESSSVLIDITLPGYETPIELDFQPHQLNIFNANNLGLSNAQTSDALPNLPDGIYTITIKMCPYDVFSFTKNHLQNCQQLCAFKNQLIATDILCCCDEKAEKAKIKLSDISLLIEASQAHADRCNIRRAMEHYRKADELLNQLTDLCL